MKKRKLVTITTGMFELTLFWNGLYVSLQATVFLGLLAILLFSQKTATKRMCLVFLLIDIVAMLFVLLNGISVVVEDYDENATPKKETLDIDVSSGDSTKSEEPKNEEPKKPAKKSKGKKSAEIRNKVPIPNPQPPKNDRPAPATAATSTQTAETPATASEVAVDPISTQPITDSTQVAENIKQEMNAESTSAIKETKSVSEFTDEDWENMFADI